LGLHRLLPGYAPTPLSEAPRLAAALGIGRLWVKNESSRVGVPAVKILGACWAVARALCERLGIEPTFDSFGQLVARAAILRPLTLAAATDGNHGRAVARMAALLGFAAQIFVPRGTASARIEAICGEGATVTVVDGTYDDAVARAAAQTGPRCLVISDTSWPGYEAVPRFVIEGYATIFWEIDDQLELREQGWPDIVFVQIGVGALAAAVVRHYRQPANEHIHASSLARPPKIVGVEPTRAACVLESMRAGQIVSIHGPQDSIMAGLNCGTPSLVAWPELSSGIDLFVTIGDERAREAMRALAEDGVVAGETGAAGVGGLIEICTAPGAEDMRAALGITSATQALVLCTEGATDPAAYQRIMDGTYVV
jgi:diaminopropionate ammonia-lyase